MKVKVNRRVDVVEEVEVPKFHKTFFRHNYFDGDKVHSISYDGKYTWLEAKVEDAISNSDKITESSKESFLKTLDGAIDRLKELKEEVQRELNGENNE